MFGMLPWKQFHLTMFKLVFLGNIFISGRVDSTEQFGIHKKIFLGCMVGLLSSWATSAYYLTLTGKTQQLAILSLTI
jgi:hypothetical protein